MGSFTFERQQRIPCKDRTARNYRCVLVILRLDIARVGRKKLTRRISPQYDGLFKIKAHFISRTRYWLLCLDYRVGESEVGIHLLKRDGLPIYA